MKVKEYLDELNRLIKENPEILEMDVIYSSDDEGNDVGPLSWGPSVQGWDKESRCFDGDSDKALCLN